MKNQKELDNKLLEDFHNNPVLVDESYNGIYPELTSKMEIYLVSILQSFQYFRIEIKGGGCSGFQYHYSIVNKVEEDDLVIKNTLLIDSNSIKYLWGSTIDWIQENFESYINIKNPAAKQSCGCGNSISFPELD